MNYNLFDKFGNPTFAESLPKKNNKVQAQAQKFQNESKNKNNKEEEDKEIVLPPGTQSLADAIEANDLQKRSNQSIQKGVLNLSDVYNPQISFSRVGTKSYSNNKKRQKHFIFCFFCFLNVFCFEKKMALYRPLQNILIMLEILVMPLNNFETVFLIQKVLRQVMKMRVIRQCWTFIREVVFNYYRMKLRKF